MTQIHNGMVAQYQNKIISQADLIILAIIMALKIRKMNMKRLRIKINIQINYLLIIYHPAYILAFLNALEVDIFLKIYQKNLKNKFRGRQRLILTIC